MAVTVTVTMAVAVAVAVTVPLVAALASPLTGMGLLGRRVTQILLRAEADTVIDRDALVRVLLGARAVALAVMPPAAARTAATRVRRLLPGVLAGMA
ncbi:hypothetical protein JYK22_20630 [Nonomuraea sp. RK-328]|nr:hypothetical protein [Nonomuraea sp. RK-328]